MYRPRQLHEQSYRVGVHDLSLDAAPCAYDKESPDPQRPRFQRGPLQMIGWLVALVYNTVADFASELVGDWAGSHVETLRRAFFNRPGALWQTPEAVIVHLDPFAGQEALLPVVDDFNAAGHRLPWLENRQVVVSLTPQGRPRAGPWRLIVNVRDPKNRFVLGPVGAIRPGCNEGQRRKTGEIGRERIAA